MTQATYVRTAIIPLNELTPFPGNAKRGEVPVILDSLRRNGQYRSLIVREIPKGQLVVLAGNHTGQALDAHGPGACHFTATVGGQERPCGICQGEPWEPSARCEVIVCDDDTARRINLVDNKSADLGQYDRDALAELLSYLDDDYHGSGYTESEVARIIQTELPDGFPAYDESIAGDLSSTEPGTRTSHTCPSCGHTFQTGTA